jgi:uncharacterized membrane protein
MMKMRVLFIGLPALTLALGIPLALRWVPPNRFYGYRTATTFSSVEAWYQVNRATGLALIAAGLISGILVLFLDQGAIALKPEPRYIMGILLSGILLLVSLVPVVLYSSRF